MARVLYSHQLAQYLPAGGYQSAYGGESAGLDLYAVADCTLWPIHEWSDPKGFTLIPTGIHLILESSEAGLIMERGSIVKTPLKLRAGVIDPSFTGRIFVNCVNLGSRPYEITEGMKLPFQLVVTPFIRATTALVDDLDVELAKIQGLRGAGEIGSSDAR